MIRKFLGCILFALFSASLTQTPVLAEPMNIELLKNEIITYHDSGTYLQEIKKVTTQANDYINQEVSLNEQSAHPKKLAIVLDIDETSLSNFKNIKLNDFTNASEKIYQQLLAADEPAISPTLELYQNAQQKNVAVFFVTGRDQSLSAATIQNLHAAGYTNWTGLAFRQGKTPSIAYKTAERAKIVQQGYTIIASIGDQESDLVGGYAERTFKLPNPFYYLP